ncbi:MAG: hypothetical protein ACREF7_04100 [Candidatus Saccharimonadales bacterium]
MQRPHEVLADSDYKRFASAGLALGSLLMLNPTPYHYEVDHSHHEIMAAATDGYLGEIAVEYSLFFNHELIHETEARADEVFSWDHSSNGLGKDYIQTSQSESGHAITAHDISHVSTVTHSETSPQVLPAQETALMSEAGIPAADHGYVKFIVGNESGWCTTKWQGEIGYCPPDYQTRYSLDSNTGYGLGQATPAIKMAQFGSDWRTNPVTQLKWANSYANSRYGGWASAYRHKVTYGWW